MSLGSAINVLRAKSRRRGEITELPKKIGFFNADSTHIIDILFIFMMYLEITMAFMIYH